MSCTPRQPTAAERQKLVETYALQKYAAIYRAPHRTQVRFHQRYRKALRVVLGKLCADSLSPQNAQGLDVAASKWWTETHKVHPGGPGRDW